MLAMPRNVRALMIQAAARLLSERGLESTSFAQVLGKTGAPRGSIYHHFPGGKNELVVAAVRLAGSVLVDALSPLDTDDPAVVVSAFVGLWRRLVEKSDFGAGCAVAAVAVGAPTDEELRAATAEVFDQWAEILAGHLSRTGMADPAARSLAVTVIAAVEGAIVLSRVTRDLRPIDTVADQLAVLAKLTR